MAHRRHGDSDRTRTVLIEGALREFNEHGYYGTDSNKIARAAGYAPGTFYNHFVDKVDVFLATYETWVLDGWATLEIELGKRPFTHCHADHTVELLVEWHERWAVFRASLRSLIAVEKRVGDAYRRSRRIQLDRICAARRVSDPRGSIEEDALLMFLVERTLDAIADGECQFHGLSRERLLASLARALVDHFNPVASEPVPASARRSVRR